MAEELRLGRAGEAIKGGLLRFLEGGAPIRRGLAGLLQGDVEPLKQAVGYGQPFPQLTPEQIRQQAFSVAMDINNPMQNVGGLLGTFAGVNARTANLAKLKEAESLRAAGVPDEQIWRTTGWSFGFPDKKPRFEISDEAAKFNTAQDLIEKAKQIELENQNLSLLVKPSNQKDLFPKQLTEARRPIKEKIKQNIGILEGDYGLKTDPVLWGNRANLVINHPDIFKAYPDAEKIIVNQGANRGADEFGAYIPSGNNIKIFKAALDRNVDNIPGTSGKSTALHEMQHAIQERENFGRGGSPTDFINELLNERQYLDSQISEINKQMSLLAKPQKMSQNAQNAYDMLMEQRMQLVPRYQQLQNPQFIQEEAFNKYKRLAGEAEARLTQARLQMTPEQRLLQYPYDPSYFAESTGVPINELIVSGVLD